MGWLWIRPGLDKVLRHEETTDSIQILNHIRRESITISDHVKINAIFVQLRKAVPKNHQNLKGGQILFSLKFFTAGEPETIELEDSKQDGQMIYAGSQHYEADSFWPIVRSFYAN